MEHVTIVGGEPCSGKTSMMRALKDLLNIDKEFEYKLLKGYHDDKLDHAILGIYKEELFAGTDRLSMAVQPDTIEFLKQAKFPNVYLEGDRLSKPSFINACLEITPNVRVIILEASPTILANRHKQRGDEQSEDWLRAKKTTVHNIKEKYPCHIFENTDVFQMHIVINYIVDKSTHKVVNPAQATLF